MAGAKVQKKADEKKNKYTSSNKYVKSDNPHSDDPEWKYKYGDPDKIREKTLAEKGAENFSKEAKQAARDDAAIAAYDLARTNDSTGLEALTGIVDVSGAMANNPGIAAAGNGAFANAIDAYLRRQASPARKQVPVWEELENNPGNYYQTTRSLHELGEEGIAQQNRFGDAVSDLIRRLSDDNPDNDDYDFNSPEVQWLLTQHALDPYVGAHHNVEPFMPEQDRINQSIEDIIPGNIDQPYQYAGEAERAGRPLRRRDLYDAYVTVGNDALDRFDIPGRRLQGGVVAESRPLWKKRRQSIFDAMMQQGWDQRIQESGQ